LLSIRSLSLETKGTQPVVGPPDPMVGEDNQTSACPQKNPKKLQTTTTPKKIQTTANNLYIVFDTNTWIYDFDDIKEILRNPYLKFKNHQQNNFKIGFPYVIYGELDGMKKYDKETPEKWAATNAINFICQTIKEKHQRFWTQDSISDSYDYDLVRVKIPDDQIVNCCAQLFLEGKDVHFFTHDTNLFCKAASNSNKYSIQAYHLPSEPDNFERGRLLKYFEKTFENPKFKIQDQIRYNEEFPGLSNQKPITNLIPSNQYNKHFPALSPSRETFGERGR